MTGCPSRERLKEFLDGAVEPPAADPVARHIDSCPTCLSALETLARDDRFDAPRSQMKKAEDDPPPEFLNRLKAANPGVPAASPPTPRPTIPGYEIQDELGRGGVGIVYKARHISLDRTVALKVLLGGGQVREDELARFRAEALAAGKLSHPGIVRVYEVGEWLPATGANPLPYVSLEYVAGGSWDRVIARTPQPPRAAAEGIAGLAAAVHAAHQEGVIHRDIKPANVLIDPATGTPKIADFGLAKRLRVDSGHTHTGMILGTPSYMAPEQARGDRGVDARADVYGLGAVLYELLTGRPPFQGPTPIDTLVQVVETDPIPPRRLQPTVPRDLETICLKCLEKDPARRYQSAADLAADVTRFLAGRPIVARPVGPVGRAVKLAKRHPVAVSLVVALVVVIVGSLAGLSALYSRAVTEKGNADQARIKAEEEKTTADTERGKADAERGKAVAAQGVAEAATAKANKAAAGVLAVNGFFQKNVLAAPRPKGVGAGYDVTLRQAIDGAEAKIRDQFRDQPEIEAGIRDTLTNTYYSLGEYDKAAAQAERVLALRRGFHAPDHPEVFSAQNNLALAHLQLGRFTEAEALLRDTLAGRERVFGPDDPMTLGSMNSLSGYLIFSAQFRAAAVLLKKAVAAHARVSPAGSLTTLAVKGNLGGVLTQLGQFAEAEPLVREVLRGRTEQLPPAHPDVILSQGALCDLLRKTGRLDEADQLAARVVESTEKAFGPESPQAFRARLTVLMIRGEQGDVDGLLLAARTLLAKSAGTFPAHHPDRLIGITDLTMLLIERHRHADAAAWVEEVLALQRKTQPKDNVVMATTLVLRAECLLAAGKPAEAETAAREALLIREKKLPPTHWARQTATSLVGECLAGQKKFSQAEPLLLSSYEALRTNEDAPSDRLRDARQRLASLYTAWGKPEEAAKWVNLPGTK